MSGLRETPVLPFQVETGALLPEVGVAEEVRNFRRTAFETLESVTGPAPLIPDYGQGYPTYGNPHGVCHARLMKGRRDVTIWHTGTQIQILDGPNRAPLVLAAASGGKLDVVLPNDTAARPPTQFLTTPDGIIIMPWGSRPLFYDGEVIGYLGYERGPAPPIAVGPGLADLDTLGALVLLLHADFGHGRMGTVSNDAGDNTRLRGAYEYAVRWKDRWRNYSPWSARSNALAWVALTPASGNAENFRALSNLLGIAQGPGETESRDIARSKDLEHAGTSTLFLLPNSPGGNVTGAHSTINDNATTMMSDNTPDTWLVVPVEEADPLSEARFARMAFRRVWYNLASDPGALIGTFPGLWGTPQKEVRVEPDPAGGELTGAWAFAGVLLIWTRTTTFQVEPNQQGSGFVSYVLHPSVGCVAVDSMASLEDGSVVWLAADGFYRYDGEDIKLLSGSIQPTIDGLNKPRLVQATAAYSAEFEEYRCWVPDSGSVENDLCLIWDTRGGGWRRRDGEKLRAVCVTKDSRQLMLGAGYVNGTSGIWVLDRRNKDFTEPTRTYTVRTGWLASQGRVSPKTVFVHAVEGPTGTMLLSVYRDYRHQASVDDGMTFAVRDPADTPPTWDTTVYDATSARWVRSRPIKPKVDVHAASCDAYQVQISGTTRFEYIGLRFGETSFPEHARTSRATS